MIRRSPREFKVSVLPSAAINDSRLSFAARGLLLFLLDKPDGWRVSVRALAGQAPGAGREACASLLSELERGGYLRRTKTQNARGLFEWHQDIYDAPQINEPCTGEPCTANPYMDTPCTANPYMVADESPSRARDNQSIHAGSRAGARVSDYCQNVNQNAPARERAQIIPRAHTARVVVINNTPLRSMVETGLVNTGLGDAQALCEERKEDKAIQASGETRDVELIQRNNDLHLGTAKPCARGARGTERSPPYLITHARNIETGAREENTEIPTKTRKKRAKIVENTHVLELIPKEREGDSLFGSEGAASEEMVDTPLLPTTLHKSDESTAQEGNENRPSLIELEVQSDTPERLTKREERPRGAADERGGDGPKRRGRKPGKMEIKPTMSGGGKLVQRFIDDWTERYKQRPAGIEAARLGKMLLECQRITECSEEEVLQAIDVYFTMEDDWILAHIHPWTALKGRFDRCLRVVRGLSSPIGETKEAREIRRIKEIGDRGVQIARQNGWVTDTRSEEEKAGDTCASINVLPSIKIPTLDEIFHPSRYKKEGNK